VSAPAAGGGSLLRRRIIVVATGVVGALTLAWGLRADPGSRRFYIGTFLLAAVWLIGGLLAGPMRIGSRRDAPLAVGVGLGLAAVFIAGAFIVRQIPWLADHVERVMDLARGGNLALVYASTVVNGVAEEVYFRGAMYPAVPERWRLVVVVGLYALVTLATGNVMLAFAAVLVGVAVTWLRQRTDGVLAPILAHVSWSLAMLAILPHLFN